MHRPFATLDVFTDRRFAGNPLAVVREAEGLEADAMQAIAREFNHPETVFVFAPADAGHRARLRIFTPRGSCRLPATRPSALPCCSRYLTAPPPGASSCWRKGLARCAARSNG